MSKQTYELQVTLKYTSGSVWRRIRVPADTNLAELHEILQDVMGWEGYHLYAFECGGRAYGEPDPEFPSDLRDASRVTLEEALPRQGAQMMYVYDFGDNWMHLITARNILPEQLPYPMCLSGSGACPPEDCGGPFGYYRLLDALENPEDSYHEDAVEWLGEDFDPKAFDLSYVNRLLRIPSKGEKWDRNAIDSIIFEFLSDQVHEVSSATYNKYERCVRTLQAALDNYGYNSSDIDYDEVQAKGKSFCQVAGLEALQDYLPGFFSYFLPRKEMATSSQVADHRATLRRFFEWMEEAAIIDPDTAQLQRQNILEMAKEETEAAELRWYEFTPVDAPPWDEVDEVFEDHFTVTQVESDRLWLDETLGSIRSISVRAPRSFTNQCREGMDLAAEIWRAGDDWYLVDVFNVYS